MATTLLIVTGASRGIGRACATAFASNPECKFLRSILIARSQDGLNETYELMKQRANVAGVQLQSSNHVMDLSDLSTLEEKLKHAFRVEEDEIRAFDRLILVNNAGSLGHLGPMSDVSSLVQLREAIDLNVTSSIWLSSLFLRTFVTPLLNINNNDNNDNNDDDDDNGKDKKRMCTIVNISSLCAVKAYKSMAVYCAGKAARDMFHAVMASEYEQFQNASTAGDNPTVKVLNYAPGVCESEMTNELCESETLDKGLSAFFAKTKEEKSFIQPDDTCQRMMKLVMSGDFESGKHIDYWDLEDIT